MDIRILAGGPISRGPDWIFADKSAVWLGVDRGSLQLAKRGIQPDYAFGDFDSLTAAEKSEIQPKHDWLSYPAEKAKTDLEIAVDWALERHPERLRIFGATGGRLDHEWVNFTLLKKTLGTGTEASLIDCQNIVFLRNPGTYTVERFEYYRYLSFFPFGQSIKGLTLEGFKYPLHEADIEIDSTNTVSNELIEKNGTYSFNDGIVMVIRSRDYS
jgi:thiamine pyrophosphokinase